MCTCVSSHIVSDDLRSDPAAICRTWKPLTFYRPGLLRVRRAGEKFTRTPLSSRCWYSRRTDVSVAGWGSPRMESGRAQWSDNKSLQWRLSTCILVTKGIQKARWRIKGRRRSGESLTVLKTDRGVQDWSAEVEHAVQSICGTSDATPELPPASEKLLDSVPFRREVFATFVFLERVSVLSPRVTVSGREGPIG